MELFCSKAARITVQESWKSIPHLFATARQSAQ